MFTFMVETVHLLGGGPFTLYLALVLLVWTIWASKALLAARYRPFRGTFDGTASVIIPVVDEAPELFREVLERIVRQHPLEIIVVINGSENPALQAVCAEAGVRCIHVAVRGKRNALRVGVQASTGDIAVLVDSDTLWTENTLSELLKPFAQASVGGVTTNQRILNPRRNVLTRWADWMESVRSEYSMPAMSRVGTVGCLPGRTIAFRRSIIEANMDRFLSERFLGVFLEVSDDRTLTNYTLMDGYRTVFQSTSLVYTDAPTSLRMLARQQKRWSRGSQYNTLRMSGWMLRHAPLLALYYFSDILVPFIIIGCLISWVASSVVPRAGGPAYDAVAQAASANCLIVTVGLAVLMTVFSYLLRFSRHFAQRSSDIPLIPVFILLNTFLLVPIRVIGFFSCARNAGWGTRRGAFRGERRRPLRSFVPAALGLVLLAMAIALAVIPGRMALA